jgi:hypothetical protein
MLKQMLEANTSAEYKSKSKAGRRTIANAED